METNEGRLARRLRESPFRDAKEAVAYLDWFRQAAGVTGWDCDRKEIAEGIVEAQGIIDATAAR